MTALLVIAGVWFGLGLVVFLLVLCALHAGNSEPTPRPVSPRPLAPDCDDEAAPRSTARVPSEVA